MASTYNYLGIEKMATGENAGTWGTKTNTNLDIIQQAASGYHSQTIAGGAQTTAMLITDGDATSTTDSLTNAARNQVIELTGTITGNQIVTFPTSTEGMHVVFNNTSGSYTVQLKGASDSGSGTTFATGDKGKKFVYMSGTDLVEIVTGTVTADSTTTFTNKTFTAPKYADGGYVADANGNENLVWGTTGSAVNEFKIANAATGSGPTLSSQGGDDNVDINITPKGTGNVVLAGDTVAVGDSGAAATLTSNGAGTLTVTTGGATDLILSTNSGTDSGVIQITDAANGDITVTPDGTGDVVLVADTVTVGDAAAAATIRSSGAGTLTVTTGGATDLILSTNNGTTSSNITITDAAGGDVTVTPSTTGSLVIAGNSTQGGTLKIYEDSDTGTNYAGFRAGNLTEDTLYTLPLADAGTSGDALTSNASGVLSWTTMSGGTSWQAVDTTGFTAVAGEGYFCNTTSAAFTATLPAGTIGDECSFIDYAGTFDTNNLTVAPDGSEKIEGTAADLTVSVERAAFTLVFTDSTQGWLLKDK
jgi:hypothetical protein